jgi:hypothetical protein
MAADPWVAVRDALSEPSPDTNAASERIGRLLGGADHART